MTKQEKGIHLLISIVERGQAAGLMELYRRYQVDCHYQSYGRGTVSSELLDILGLGESEREIVLSLASAARMRRLFAQLEQDVPVRVKGIAFSAALSAVTAGLGAALLREGQSECGEGETTMDARDHGSLILIMANRGYTEEVMNTVRAAGARGGTIVRSRFAGAEEDENLYGFALQEEKEIIAIVAAGESRNIIMEAVHKSHGPETKAGAVVCSVALEQMVRLG